MGESRNFKGHLSEYQIIETEDGSVSLHSEKYGETCHSLSGAYQETLHNYILGTNLKEQALLAVQEKRPLIILEVGLGAGYGPVLSFEHLTELIDQEDLSLHFFSLEIDPGLEAFCQQHWKDRWPSHPGFKLQVLVGDARESISQIKENSVDVIFQDPFSPKRNPRLWTKEWFESLKQTARDSSVMTTYCASVRARKAMLAAGWKLENLAGFANKRSATRAFLRGQNDPDLISRLSESSTLPFSDTEL